MSTVEKTAAIRAIATALVHAAGQNYRAIAPYWTFKTAQGNVSLYSAASAAGYSKADVIAAADKRQTKDGRDYYRVPVTVAAGQTAGKAGKAEARQAASAAAFLASVPTVPRLIKRA